MGGNGLSDLNMLIGGNGLSDLEQMIIHLFWKTHLSRYSHFCNTNLHNVSNDQQALPLPVMNGIYGKND